MADAYQKETSTDLFLLEDGSGVYLLEVSTGGGAGDQQPVIFIVT